MCADVDSGIFILYARMSRKNNPRDLDSRLVLANVDERYFDAVAESSFLPDLYRDPAV